MTKTIGDKLAESQRIVIKIGSSLLIDPASGGLRHAWLKGLADDVAALKKNGQHVVLVSSGAIALGAARLGNGARPKSLDRLQAAAAIGQIRLAAAYAQAFEPSGIEVAQLLISLHDFEDRRQYLNARATVEALFESNVVPVFNENDTVATSEIRFGDNDRLAARTAGLVNADLLILLSDVDGLYSADPLSNRDAIHQDHVSEITPDIMALAGPARSTGPGTGGMASKLEAARIATEGGTAMVIAKGLVDRPIKALINGARHTLFDTHDSPLAVRKRWLRGLSSPRGFLHLDAGATEAVKGGASLLAVGVTEVLGDFGRGDAVALMAPDGTTVALGLAGMPASVVQRIIGCTRSQAEAILGHVPRSALVHRDDLVVF